MKPVFTHIASAFLFFLFTGSLTAQPIIDGVFDGETVWGSPVATADLAPGWANANAKKLYAVQQGSYVYIGAEVTASTWMNWAFTIQSKSGGGSYDSWSRSIDYTNTNKIDYIFRGHFNGYSEFHNWNGSTWSGVGTAVNATEFAENITSADQNGWVEIRILKSAIGSPALADLQFYITGDQNAHGSFDAVPNDDNATSWNQSANRSPLDNHITGINMGGGPIVTVLPALPAEQQSITITFNASTTALAASTKVYLHAGVSLQHNQHYAFDKVTGNWGQDDGVGEMVLIAPSTWQIVIPNAMTYFGVAASEDIFGLNFLFRNADGSIKDDNNASNYHNEINPGNYLVIASPSYSPFMPGTNEDFDFTTISNNTADNWLLEELDVLTGTVMDTLSTQTGNDTFHLSLNLPNTLLHRYKVKAYFGAELKTREFEVLAHNAVLELPRPAWSQPGINYHTGDATKATLVLHAPVFTRFYKGNAGPPATPSGTNATAAKSVVYVVGDFNNWTPSEAYKLNRDRDGWDGTSDADGDGDKGDYWWIEINGLQPGQNYVFQYLMDGALQLADPFATQICDPDDASIPSSVYPNLPAYPSQAMDRAAVINTSQEVYNWSAPAFVKPSTNNLNIYELHFRDFTKEGTYLAAIDKLDYIQSLGINAIHVMPISEFEGNSSWGYNPNFYFAADKAYGKSNDLKKFIDECHKRKIQVFNDIVLNHAFLSHPMAKMYWNVATNKPTPDNPWFNEDHKMIAEPAGWWGVDWNHESEHTRYFVDRVLNYWLSEFKFDGFRFDFTKGFGQTAQDPGDPWASSYDQDRVDILKRMVSTMWSNRPGSVAIFEHLAVNAEDKVLADFGISMWSGVGHHNDVKSWVLGWNGDNPNLYDSGIYNAPARNFIFANWISYPESHDEERLGYELMQYFNGPKTTSNMVDRLKMGYQFNLLFPGPRMLWQMGELGYDVSINFNGRTGEKPVKWQYFKDSKRRELYNQVRRVFSLRNQYGLYTVAPDYGNIGLGSGNITTPRRMMLNDGVGHYVISVANLDPAASHLVTPGFPVNGTWYRYNGTDAEDGTSFTVTGNTDTYNLMPSSAYLFTNLPAEKCQLVYKSADAGPGSLRYALACAQPGDTIRFLHSVLSDTIQLLTPIDIDKNIVIEGNLNYPMVLSAAQSDRAIHVLPGVSCELNGLMIQGGSDTSGSCIFNEGTMIANRIKCTKSSQSTPVSLLYNASGATIEYRGQNQIE
jgi:1,4-alpha-glucan branching enzyme